MTVLFATFTITALALAYHRALRAPRHDGLITVRPYNNRHNDASAARDGSFGENRLLLS